MTTTETTETSAGDILSRGDGEAPSWWMDTDAWRARSARRNFPGRPECTYTVRTLQVAQPLVS